jgi:hypothetical protein
MKKRDDYSAPNLNDQLLKEFNKKKILKNLNDKFSSDHASKPASELHEDRMVMPRDDEGIFSHAKQQDVNDDFINELVNEKEGVPGGNFVQANWNVGGSHLRETTHIPICDDPEGKITGFENDYDDPKYRVHGGKGPAAMGTIREDALEESKYSDGNGSDTAYFTHDDSKGYDSAEVADYRKRKSQLY